MNANTTLIRTNVLDHGYLSVVDSWGSDQVIVEAARMSTDKGFLGWEPGDCPVCNGSGREWIESTAFLAELLVDVVPCHACEGKGTIPGDMKLLRTLKENNHDTPFEMAGLIIEVQAPIFVFREWHRHRTQSYNEMSARYTPLPNLNYIPTIARLMMNSKTNKQAGTVKGADELTIEVAAQEQDDLAEEYEQCERNYQRALKRGVPKELARVRLPVGRYSRMRASTCLRNWLAFLTLRDHAAAQWEIRQYAEQVNRVLVGLYPRTMQLFEESRKQRRRLEQLRRVARTVMDDDGLFEQLTQFASVLQKSIEAGATLG